MAGQFSVNNKDLEQLKQFYKQAPKAFERVSAGTLNSMAFHDRNARQRILTKETTIRSPGLLKSGLRVKLTNKTDSIDKQQSESFSISRPRHDGWESFINNKTVDLNLQIDEGRAGGSWGGRAKPGAKIKRGAHTAPEDVGFSRSMTDQDVINYMQRISSMASRRRKSWLLPVQFRTMGPGIYKFIGGKVKQKFVGNGKRRTINRSSLYGAKIVRLSEIGKFKPPRINWQSMAYRDTLRRENITNAWTTNFDRELEKIKIR